MVDRRTFLQGIGTFSLAGVLTGCTEGETALRVSWLEGSLPPRLIEDFQKTLPHRGLRFKSETSLDNLMKLLKARREKTRSLSSSSPTFSFPFSRKTPPPETDLVTLGDAWLASAIAEKLIEPLDRARLSNWGDLPSRWRSLVTRDRDGFEDAGGVVWGAPYRWGLVAIAYNREKFRRLDRLPQDWSDLWREDLKGRIALIDNAREVIGLTLKKSGHSYNTTDLALVPHLKAELFALQEQVRLYSSRYYLQPLLVGDVWLSVGWSSDILPLTQQHEEIEMVVPRSGTSLWSDVWVRPSSGADNPLVDEWIDFCWQTPSAERISVFTDGLSPIILDRPPGKLPEDIRENPLLSDRAILERSEFLLPLPEKTRLEIERLWEEMRRSP